MEPGIRKIIGLASVCGVFALFMAFLLAQIYARTYIGLFFGGMVLAIIVIINGFYMMTGTKFALSYDFWKNKFGGGYPLWFGAILEFYIDIIGVIIFCIFLVIFVAPSQVQRLFILLVGTTVVCLLLYFRFKDRRTLESYTPHR